MSDDDGLDQRFSIGGPQSSWGQYFIYPSHRLKLEKNFDDLCLFYLDIPEIYFDNSFEIGCEKEKNI